MKIAMIGLRTIPSNYGGIERHVENYAPRIAARGKQVVVYSRSYCGPRTTYKNVQIQPVPSVSSKHLDTAVYTLFATIHAIFSGVDVIHYHGIGPALFSFIPRIFRIPSVVTVHALDWQRAKWGRVASFALQIGEWLSCRMPCYTIVVSRLLKNYLRKKYQAKTYMIPNAVDLPVQGNSERIRNEFGLEPGKYILFTGRLVPEKGLHYLIDAYHSLPRYPYQLVIAGGEGYSKTYSDELRSSARRDPRIRFIGFVEGETLNSLYSNALLFVLPSDLEGLSVSLTEAMSYGIPSLVSDIFPNLEAISDTEFGCVGFSFRKGDRNDLSRKLEEVLENQVERQLLATQSRQLVATRLNWELNLQDLELIYSMSIKLGYGEKIPQKLRSFFLPAEVAS